MNYKGLLRVLVKSLASWSAGLTEAVSNYSVGECTPLNKPNYDIDSLLNKFLEDFDKVKELLEIKESLNCVTELKDAQKFVLSRKLNIIATILQEIHNKMSIEMNIEPSNVIFFDFAKNPKMFEMDMCDVDPETNNLFINSNEKVIKAINGYDMLQYLFTITYQNKINKTIKSLINDDEWISANKQELFVILFQAIHRFNHFELKDDGYEPEIEYLQNLEDLAPVDIFSNLFACYKLKKVFKKCRMNFEAKQEAEMEIKDYFYYIKTDLAVKAMKVAKIELFTFLTHHKDLPKIFKQVLMKLYKELGDEFFKACGAEIEDGKNWTDYLNKIDNRFIVRNRNWLNEGYVSESLIQKLIERHEEFFTDEEFENAMAIQPDDDMYYMHTEFNKGLSMFLEGYDREDSLLNRLAKYHLYFRDFSGIEDVPYDPVENLPSMEPFENN